MHPTQSLLPSVLLLLTLSSASASFWGSYYRYVNCTPYPFTCGATKINIRYPFRVDGRPDYCGHPTYYIACSKDNTSMTVDINGKGYQVKAVDYLNHLITVVDQRIVAEQCPRPYQNTSVDFSLYNYSDRDRNVTLFINCSFLSPISDLYHFDCASNITGRHWYYQVNNENPVDLLGKCDSKVLVPMHQTIADELANRNLGFGDAVKEGFSLVWTAGKGWCCDCVNSGGRCGYDSLSPANHTCYCPDGSAIGTCSKDSTSSGHQSKRNVGKVILIGCFSSAGVFLLLCVCFLFYWYKRRQPSLSSKSLIRNASLKPSLKDPEMSSAHLQTHLFSYTELQEATSCFDASKELGDGGFGTVYKGKLRDGRTVAVKRLYENNCRRLEQFMNEIDILSCLHHRNLVSLYGCTSRQSRELLLVYEFVPNGTVADHLHGSRASEGILTWSMRLNIAIETADALAYLHAVNPPIIHRDVKTSNILLDGSFHVKVADFGLSRFFPTDVTHISTAPQGTPGYLDPEYHQCYQLTDKSDVYSFGVVLIELISSKPAIDLTRHRSEINLANMAVTRIQNGELEQLVDADLGYLSDQAIRKMMTMVGEVAFRCLQSDRDMRPPMMEILEVLRAIESEVHKVEEKGQDAVENRDDAESLKNTIPLSPDSVMNKWASRSTTPNTSE